MGWGKRRFVRHGDRTQRSGVRSGGLHRRSPHRPGCGGCECWQCLTWGGAWVAHRNGLLLSGTILHRPHCLLGLRLLLLDLLLLFGSLLLLLLVLLLLMPGGFLHTERGVWAQVPSASLGSSNPKFTLSPHVMRQGHGDQWHQGKGGIRVAAPDVLRSSGARPGQTQLRQGPGNTGQQRELVLLGKGGAWREWRRTLPLALATLQGRKRSARERGHRRAWQPMQGQPLGSWMHDRHSKVHPCTGTALSQDRSEAVTLVPVWTDLEVAVLSEMPDTEDTLCGL